MKIIHGDQGTEEWLSLRIASIGGTAINSVMAGGQGKMRKSLMYAFVGELLSGQKKEITMTAYMEAGILHESDARLLYEIETDIDVEEVSIILGDKPHTHFSPDGLLNDDGVLEIKTVIPSVWAERKLTKKIPLEYYRQCMWGMYITGRQWADFVCYCPYLTDSYPLFTQMIERDEKIIEDMTEASDKFIAEMLEMYNKVKV